MPCCGWRNQAGRSQPGDWHIAVGDDVKAAFKLLCVNLHTHTHTHPGIQTYGINTDVYKHILYTVNRNTDWYPDRHTDRETHTQRRTQLLMCPLMQSEDKLLPLKAKPNQTRSVISVTVVFGFKAVRLTSDKTSMQSHPRSCAWVQPHAHMFALTQAQTDTGTHTQSILLCSWIREEELCQLLQDPGLCHQKATKPPLRIGAY